MADYAVGDIQGCYDPLRRILDQVDFDPARDRLWSVGDLVNRGPRSLDTLRFLRQLGDAFRAVLGNHDLHLLALTTGAFTEGQKQYLRPVLDAPDRDELYQWLRRLPLITRTECPTAHGNQRFVLVHAGLAPSWSLDQAFALAAEVEAELRGPAPAEFLRCMYGNHPDAWDDRLSGMERLRTITNYLTRVRFCGADGKLDFHTKTGIGTAPKGYRPWFEFLRLPPYTQLVFGHWASLEGVTGRPAVHALDTGCVWGRQMTLLRLQDGRRFSLACGPEGT